MTRILQIYGCARYKIYLWNAETAELIHSFEEHSMFISVLLFDEKLRCLISGSWDATMKIFDVDHNDKQRYKCVQNITIAETQDSKACIANCITNDKWIVVITDSGGIVGLQREKQEKQDLSTVAFIPTVTIKDKSKLTLANFVETSSSTKNSDIVVGLRQASIYELKAYNIQTTELLWKYQVEHLSTHSVSFLLVHKTMLFISETNPRSLRVFNALTGEFLFNIAGLLGDGNYQVLIKLFMN